jgi:hypothetical protein
MATVTATPGATGGTTGAIDTTGASLIVVSVSWAAFADANTPTDNKGNAYLALTQHASGTTKHQFWYATTPTVGPGHTFTVTSGGSIYPAIIVQAFSGAPATPFETQNGGSGFSPASAGSITPAANGALVVTGIAGASALGSLSVSPAMTQTTVPFVGGVTNPGATAFLVQAVAAAITPVWTYTGGSGTALSVASFRSAAPAGLAASQVYVWLPE